MPYKDPEKARENARLRGRRYEARHREKRREKNRKYRTDYLEDIRVRDRAFKRAIAPEKRREAYRSWRANNLERRTAYEKAWRVTNRDAVVIMHQRRRARKHRAPHNDLTLKQWREIKEHYGHCCVYCGKSSQRLTQDHITPLSKGGSHTASNILPACKSCNSRKHTGPPPVPVQPLLLTIAPPRKKKVS